MNVIVFQKKEKGREISIEDVSGETLNDMLLFANGNNGQVISTGDRRKVRVAYHGRYKDKKWFYKKISEILSTK